MRFFNKNLVLVLFLFLVACNDGFDEKAYEKDKNRKPNQISHEKHKDKNYISYEKHENKKLPPMFESFNHEISPAFEEIRPYLNPNYKELNLPGMKNLKDLENMNKAIDDEYIKYNPSNISELVGIAEKYGRPIHIYEYESYIAPAEFRFSILKDLKNKKIDAKYVKTVQEEEASWERIVEARGRGDGTYTGNDRDYE